MNANEIKYADEIARKLRAWKGMVQTPGVEPLMMKAADEINHLKAEIFGQADLIESLQAENKHLRKQLAGYTKQYLHLEKQLEASQRREKAAVEEIDNFTKERMQQLTLEESLILQPVLNRIYTIRKRGPQETGEES